MRTIEEIEREVEQEQRVLDLKLKISKEFSFDIKKFKESIRSFIKK